jgi:hypothetical protein
VLRKILTDREFGPMLPKGNPFGSSGDTKIKLPSWLSKGDLKHYADKYEKKGFTGGLNGYRALDLYVFLAI